MGSPLVRLHWNLVTLKGQCQGHSNFKGLHFGGVWWCSETDVYKYTCTLNKRYFASATCPLGMKLNWISGHVVKHHKQTDKAHGPLVETAIQPKTKGDSTNFVLGKLWLYRDPIVTKRIFMKLNGLAAGTILLWACINGRLKLRKVVRGSKLKVLQAGFEPVTPHRSAAECFPRS